jgi:hypothetical protein
MRWHLRDAAASTKAMHPNSSTRVRRRTLAAPQDEALYAASTVRLILAPAAGCGAVSAVNAPEPEQSERT